MHREKGCAMKIDDMDLSPELREKAKACKTPDEMLALAKAEGYKLSEEELAAVSGGRDVVVHRSRPSRHKGRINWTLR